LEDAEDKAAETVKRRKAELERKNREELEDICRSMKEASVKEAEENRVEVEDRLRKECEAKVKEIKADYDAKIRDEIEQLQRTLASALKEAETELREKHKEQLEDSLQEIQDSEARMCSKAKAAHEEAADRLAAEEDKLRAMRGR